jgi:hypothetical protein
VFILRHDEALGEWELAGLVGTTMATIGIGATKH